MGRKKKLSKKLAYGGLAMLAVTAVGVSALALAPREPAKSEAFAIVAAPSAQPAAVDNLKPLRQALAANAPVTVYGLGSSVGNAASLAKPELNTPVAYLAQKLGALTTSGATAANLSVDGSVAVEGVALYREKVHPAKPTVLLLAYGMNDGETLEFNSGETLPGGVKAVADIVHMAMSDGVTVLIATTPSPHTERTNFTLPAGMPVGYAEMPENITTAGGAPFSTRHHIFNQKMADVAVSTGATLVDVEPSWTAAVAAQGQDALYDRQESAHPNLAGHTASYRAALDALISRL